MSEADGAVRRGSCFFEAKRHSGTGVPLDRVERTWGQKQMKDEERTRQAMVCGQGQSLPGGVGGI